jgi:predicted Zn-dependent protease
MMDGHCPQSVEKTLSRREFMLLGVSSAVGVVIGCATDPVTGRSQFNMISEESEISLDKQHAPHQFSKDYGALQDDTLNAYIAQVGGDMVAHTHRPHMPYSFRGVNAVYVNAYAFPGGSIAATRGILLKLDNEAELAALLGHELGHVNARHAAEQMSKGLLAQGGLMIGSVLVGTQFDLEGSELNQIMQLGMLGASALLATYSRDNEREADALGMDYLVRSGYSPDGMVGLMEMLNSLNKQKPASSLTFFATHPMSSERLNTAVGAAQGLYRAAQDQPLRRERYMDHTAQLRRLHGAIEKMQTAEAAMAGNKLGEAESLLRDALREAPDDYACLLLMSKCLATQGKNAEALKYAEQAQQTYPEEAQAHQVAGFVELRLNLFRAAYNNFNAYERRLPGAPSVAFFKGFALEGMQQRSESAENYYRYLQAVQQGDMAKYAYQRLVQWGYIRK